MKHTPGQALPLLQRLSHRRIDPPPVAGQMALTRLIDETFLSYNAGRLREACRLYATKMLAEDAVVGLSLSGALNLAALMLEGSALRIDPLRDVNQSAALVYEAKRNGGRSGVLILGGGSPKNFVLQTEPQIQEVLGLEESGHDYFLQVTDARPDTGGLSGATPSEAMTWGKVDPETLPDTVTCYLDSTVALPLMTAYALAKRPPRPLRRLMDRLDEVTRRL